MKTLDNILILLFFLPVRLCAYERSLTEVQNVACAFFSQMEFDSSYGAPPRLSSPEITPFGRDSIPYLYIVNNNRYGWCIVSNDTRYASVIGYGRSGYCPTDTALMPNGMRWLMEHHMNMIDSLHANPDSAFNMTNPYNMLTSDSSLYVVGTKLLCRNGKENYWNQSGNESFPVDSQKTYNKFCPDFYQPTYGRTYAGCSAVAVGQVLWYWGFPDRAVIPKSIDPLSVTHGHETHYYDWRNMPNLLTNSTEMYQVDQVAGLLRDCGYAEHMLYTPGASAATTYRMYEALTETFHYHALTIYEDSVIVSPEMIKAEIDELRPVICQAYKLEWGDLGAHSFVIDGYDVNEMFHINWGWGEDDQDSLNAWMDMGFQGYYSSRSFITEIYPDCEAISEYIAVSPTNVIDSAQCVAIYGRNHMWPNGVNTQMTIKSGGHLILESDSEVTLISGFTAEYGSDVYIGIRNFCEHPKSALSYYAKAKRRDVPLIEDLTERIQDGIKIVPNPVSNILHVHSDEDIEQLTIYNISGQFITRTNQLEINVSGLPQGIYLLRAVTTDGQVRQAKFIKE